MQTSFGKIWIFQAQKYNEWYWCDCYQDINQRDMQKNTSYKSGFMLLCTLTSSMLTFTGYCKYCLTSLLNMKENIPILPKHTTLQNIFPLIDAAEANVFIPCIVVREAKSSNILPIPTFLLAIFAIVLWDLICISLMLCEYIYCKIMFLLFITNLKILMTWPFRFVKCKDFLLYV